MSETVEELKQRLEEEVGEKEDIEREELEEEMNFVYKKVKRRPRREDMNSFGEYSDRDYVEEYGSWEDAVDTILSVGDDWDVSGLDGYEETEDIPTEDLIEELQRLAMKMGRVPSTTSMNNIGEYSSSDYRSEFGGWEEALIASQIPQIVTDGEDKTGGKVDELIEEVQKVAMKLGRVPTGHEATEHSEYPYIEYYREFGAWNNVLRAANIEEENND